MIGELASSLPREGGFYYWVRRAMGPFWGFQEAWLSLAASVFDMAIYPTTFVLYLSHVAPSLTAGHRGLLLKLAIVIISAAWNLRGAVAVGVGSQRMMVMLISPFVVLIALALWHSFHHGVGPIAAAAQQSARANRPGRSHPRRHVELHGLGQRLHHRTGGRRPAEYLPPRDAQLRACRHVRLHPAPGRCLALAGIPAERFSTGAWVDAAMLLGGPVLAMAVVLAGSLDGLGTFNALTLSLTRLPYAMAEDGLLPKVLARRWANGVPWVSVLACSFGWAFALGFTFERLISIDLVLYGAALLLEFVALVVLRLREPSLARPFKIPGGTSIAIAAGVGPTLLIAFALWAARDERVGPFPALAFAAVIAAVGPLLYLAARTRKPASSQ